MTRFADEMMLKLRDPASLETLVAPQARALFSAAYDLPFATVQDVKDVKVERTEFQLPLFGLRRTSGVWTQTIPAHTRTDVVHERPERAPQWIDVLADLTLVLLLDVDPAGATSFQLGEPGDFATIQEFKDLYPFLDLDPFLAEHHITTVAELKEAFNYLRAEIALAPHPPFDPDDPVNEHRFELHLAILLRDAIDLAGALRDAKLVRAVAERTISFRPTAVGAAEVRTPYAPVVIFPADALAATPFDETKVTAFFASERVLALFTTTS
jgi:hypothetical protein